MIEEIIGYTLVSLVGFVGGAWVCHVHHTGKRRVLSALTDLERVVEELEASPNFPNDAEAREQAAETRAYIADARRRWL